MAVTAWREFYNLRGGKERIFDDLNNGFGWARLPKSFMAGPESRIPHAILDGDSTDHEHAEGGDLGGRQCDGREGRNENMQHADGTGR